MSAVKKAAADIYRDSLVSFYRRKTRPLIVIQLTTTLQMSSFSSGTPSETDSRASQLLKL